MNLNPLFKNRNGRWRSSAVALVVTLLMLSVITFLAVAFLAVTRRDREATASALDQGDAHTMEEVALARAQSEIIAHMQARKDLLNYDLISSHNFINPNGFVSGGTNVNNVNYDFRSDGSPLTDSDRIQNIANLLYDPRAPVYVKTNRNGSNDFRFWVDLNRNGVFESDGYHPVMGEGGQLLSPTGTDTTTAPYLTNYFDGEPEWIGLLRNPEYPHASTNRFIGRYAYLVLPAGKTLDINFIHNHAKAGALTGDGYLRNQGVGSWELNLGGYLRDLNGKLWNGTFPYVYSTNAGASSGLAFNDAREILANRYTNNLNSLLSAQSFFGTNTVFNGGNVDGYSAGPPYFTLSTNYLTPDTDSWPGSDNPRTYYNMVDELFDGTRTPNFTADLQNVVNATAGFTTSSYNRYTFQRLLASIGTDSAPELQVLVHGDGLEGVNNLVLRTKVNINFCNTNEIQNNLNTSATNRVPWTPLGFFTNAADLLLRSQIFVSTNRIDTNNIVLTTNCFGITNIPIFSSTNTGYRYNLQVHRMLQLAANIYDAANNNASLPSTLDPTRKLNLPSVFRPLFRQDISGTNTNVFIVAWTNVTTDIDAIMARPFRLLTDPISPVLDDGNIWGIPLIVGAKKGLPNFNEYAYANSLLFERKVEFTRASVGGAITTNQYYISSLSNVFGIEAWNSYNKIVPRDVTVLATNFSSIWYTNELGYGITNSVGLSITTNYINPASFWPAYVNQRTNSFKLPMLTNTITLPQSYYSETQKRFLAFATNTISASDRGQGFGVHAWQINVTNRMAYVLIDQQTRQVLDYASFAEFGSSLNVNKELTNSTVLIGSSVASKIWSTNGAGVTTPSQGLINQINIGRGLTTDPDFVKLIPLNGQPDGLNSFLSGDQTNQALVIWCPYEPDALLIQAKSWVVNDPLVHYTLDDLQPFKEDERNGLQPINGGMAQASSNLLNYLNLGLMNASYQPWDVSSGHGAAETFKANLIYKDPLIKNSDAWDFPTNKFPSIGWLGRVHRGTPWQTVFLKADNANDADKVNNPDTWSEDWAHSPTTYPTNDWALMDLFTTTPNDNAARGLLSINQTNRAAWSAALSGVIVLNNGTDPYPIDPTDLPGILETANTGINAVRLKQTNGVFHSIGDLLSVPTLTTMSSFLGGDIGAAAAFRDEVVERIPQQIMSLVKIGQPRFVIYAYGQSLKPKDVALTGGFVNLCTNYSITGEFVTRTVCHVEGTIDKPKIVVDNFNILTGD